MILNFPFPQQKQANHKKHAHIDKGNLWNKLQERTERTGVSLHNY